LLKILENNNGDLFEFTVFQKDLLLILSKNRSGVSSNLKIVQNTKMASIGAMSHV